MRSLSGVRRPRTPDFTTSGAPAPAALPSIPARDIELNSPPSPSAAAGTASGPAADKAAATCLTYGQWLQMKVTTSAGPVRSSRLTVAPVAGSDNENAGAAVPSASMVDSMAIPARVTFLSRETTGEQPLDSDKRLRKGSRLDFEITQLRFLTPDVALVQAKGAVVKGRERNGLDVIPG